jgi:integrase
MPKRIVALTDERILNLKPAAARRTVYDPALPGLAIRVQPSGHKTFVFGARYPRTGQFTRVELGQVGRLKLEAARDKARRWAAWIAAGVDPRDEEAKLQKAAVEAAALAIDNSFKVVAETFIARHVKGQRKAEVVAREIRKELISHWSARPITEITRRDIVDLVEKIVDRPAPAHARNVLQHAKKLFAWAIQRDVYGLQSSPCDRVKPTELVGVKTVRTRVLTDKELQALWAAADTLGYPFGPATKMLMLTGARLNEVMGARWSEFSDDDDDEKRLWTIPAARFKMNAQHFVPVTDELAALLETIPRWTQGDHLFSSTSGAKPVRFNDRVVTKLRAPVGAELSWSLHDIRRTVRTRLSALRIPEPVAEMVIGHARKGLQRVYDQHRYLDEMREALQAWGMLLRGIVEPPPPNVVPLGARKAR